MDIQRRTTNMRGRGPNRRLLILQLVLALAASMLVLGANHSGDREVIEVPAVHIAPAGRPGSAVARPAAAAPATSAFASDGRPIMPPGPPMDAHDGPVHPHPITQAHARIYRENNLVGALNRAVDLEDAARIRELVDRYRAEFPEDQHVLQDGYEIIAACLEQPGEAARAAAHHFWTTQIRSQTRRDVRRHCL